MYSLEINFLKDRKVEEDLLQTSEKKPAGISLAQNLPMLIGLGVMVLLPAATGALLLVVNSQTASTQERIQALDTEISQLGAQNQRIQEMEQQVTAVNDETQAFVSVFTQIKPWSAILQDIRDRVPKNVQIDKIEQKGATSQGSTATPATGTTLTITGVAGTYDDINDLVLSLQQSNFLQAKKTKLISAEEADFPIGDLPEDERTALQSRIRLGQLPGVPKNLQLGQGNLKETYTFPKVVKYEIQTELGDIPASKLTKELASKGAVGLVTRLRTLEQKGVIQP
jgi:type IV pilus assembly protein PilN